MFKIFLKFYLVGYFMLLGKAEKRFSPLPDFKNTFIKLYVLRVLTLVPKANYLFKQVYQHYIIKLCYIIINDLSHIFLTHFSAVLLYILVIIQMTKEFIFKQKQNK